MLEPSAPSPWGQSLLEARALVPEVGCDPVTTKPQVSGPGVGMWGVQKERGCDQHSPAPHLQPAEDSGLLLEEHVRRMEGRRSGLRFSQCKRKASCTLKL